MVMPIELCLITEQFAMKYPAVFGFKASVFALFLSFLCTYFNPVFEN
jgi:hypothetical protein